ncbi:Fic family protein [bacterium]|nr:Fic family protein [bacterium]
MKPFLPEMLPRTDLDWEALFRDATTAQRALAYYDGKLGSLPHPEVLVSPLITQEAVISSRIEGTVVTLEEVLQLEADVRDFGDRERDIRETLNYRRAVWQAAYRELPDRPFGLNLVKRLHWILLENVRGDLKGRGEFRKQDVYIGSPNSSMEEATYIPPPHWELEGLLSNWEKYYHRDDERDELVQLALLHAQFELIHPFLDGNGRVGRMLIPLFLHDKQLLSSPVLYISAYLKSKQIEYFNKLRALSQGEQPNSAWQDWVTYFLRAVRETAEKNAGKAEAIRDLYGDVQDVFKRMTRSRFATAVEALDYLFGSPILKGPDFWRATGLSDRQSASKLLKQLVDEDVLVVARQGERRRPTVYAFPRLLDIVES